MVKHFKGYWKIWKIVNHSGNQMIVKCVHCFSKNNSHLRDSKRCLKTVKGQEPLVLEFNTVFKTWFNKSRWLIDLLRNHMALSTWLTCYFPSSQSKHFENWTVVFRHVVQNGAHCQHEIRLGSLLDDQRVRNWVQIWVKQVVRFATGRKTKAFSNICMWSLT